MPANKVSQAFVEITAKGLSQVKAELDTLQRSTSQAVNNSNKELRQLGSSLTGIPPVKVEVDKAEFERDVATLKQALASLDGTVQPELDPSKVKEAIARLSSVIELRPDLDTSEVKNAIGQLDGTVQLKGDLDASKIDSQLAEIGSQLADLPHTLPLDLDDRVLEDIATVQKAIKALNGEIDLEGNFDPQEVQKAIASISKEITLNPHLDNSEIKRAIAQLGGIVPLKGEIDDKEVKRKVQALQRLKGKLVIDVDTKRLNNSFANLHQQADTFGEKAKKAGSKGAGGLGQIVGALRSIGAATALATGGLSLLAGGMIALASTASPRDFQEFQTAIGRVAIQIGRIFLPILRSLTQGIGLVADLIGSLGDGFRESVVDAVQFAASLGGLLPFLIQAATAFGPFIQRAIEFAGTIRQMVEPIIQNLGGILVSLARTFAVLLSAVQPVMEAINTVILRVVGQVVDIIRELAEMIEQLVTENKPALEQIGQVFQEVVGDIGDVIESLFPILRSLMPVVQSVFTLAGGILRSFAAIFQSVWALIRPIIQGLIGLIRDFSTAFGEGMRAIQPIIDGVITALVTILERLTTAIQRALEAAASAGQAAANLTGGANSSQPVNGILAWSTPGFLINRFFGQRPGQGNSAAGGVLASAAAGAVGPATFDPNRVRSGQSKDRGGRFQGSEVQNPQILDLIGAWRKAQESVNPTPEQRLQAERQAQQLQATQSTQQAAQGILSWLQGNPPTPPGFAA